MRLLLHANQFVRFVIVSNAICDTQHKQKPLYETKNEKKLNIIIITAK